MGTGVSSPPLSPGFFFFLISDAISGFLNGEQNNMVKPHGRLVLVG
jgi:hypothetical protein